MVLDSRLLDLWAAGKLSNGALRVYTYACLRREPHGPRAKVGDREMSEGAKVGRKPSRRDVPCLADYLAELEHASAAMDPCPFAVVRSEKHRTVYIVPRPPRGPVDNSSTGPATRTRAAEGAAVDNQSDWSCYTDQSGAATRTSLQEGQRPPHPPHSADAGGGDGQRRAPPPSGSPPAPGCEAGRSGGGEQGQLAGGERRRNGQVSIGDALAGILERMPPEAAAAFVAERERIRAGRGAG